CQASVQLAPAAMTPGIAVTVTSRRAPAGPPNCCPCGAGPCPWTTAGIARHPRTAAIDLKVITQKAYQGTPIQSLTLHGAGRNIRGYVTQEARVCRGFGCSSSRPRP